MSLVVGVRFADAGKLYYYDPGDMELCIGDCVLVETSRGTELGEVVIGPREVEETGITSTLKQISKRADDQDFRKLEQNVKREEEAFRICEERIKQRQMPMKLIDVEHTFDGSKLIFYFAAEGRVDFRELVKDLASVFRTRIELRQIGVRDEAKKIGGLGPCGRPACCNSFLRDFVPVSIKMAKEQNLSLSPTKISGLCGRLMCCLHYEHEHYREMHWKLPRVGSTVGTPDGPAEVVDTDALTGRIKARVTLRDGTLELRKYELEDVSVHSRGGEKHHAEPETADAGGSEEQAPAQNSAHHRKERRASGHQHARRTAHSAGREQPKQEHTKAKHTAEAPAAGSHSGRRGDRRRNARKQKPERAESSDNGS